MKKFVNYILIATIVIAGLLGIGNLLYDCQGSKTEYDDEDAYAPAIVHHTESFNRGWILTTIAIVAYLVYRKNNTEK